ncbi:MAG: leucine-rich repeat domain-containing protein [Verrucomicrobiales bacterium]|nr:leucine-rich repeat domain-containing protein [Verrucomicrobiales bacterium]
MNKLTKLIAVSALLFNLAALSIKGADIDDLTWEINDDDTVSIIDCNQDATGDLIIPDVIDRRIVTSIGNQAFSYCQFLTSITIPDSVTSIGGGGFFGCIGLTSVTIGEGVTSIGDQAFEKCISLTSVTIPDSVTNLGEEAFNNCSSLTSVTIGEGVTSMAIWVFRNCISLTNIVIPDSVTSIDALAFGNCSSLTSVTIPDSVTSIGTAAFMNCSSLISITIPDSVTSIGERAFEKCSNLTSVTIPDSVTGIGERAFMNCSSLTSVRIPDSVTIIGSYAFRDCSGLSEVTFLGDKPSFGQGVFDGVSAVVLYPSFASGYSNPLAGLMAYKDGDYDPVNHHHQKTQLEVLKQIRDNGRDAQQNTQLEVLKQIRDQLQTLNAKMLDLQASVVEKDAKIAQLEQRPTLEEVQEGREGSVVLEVDPEGGTVTLGLTIEQSGDLIDWTPIEGELTRTIPIPDGKKFYRFALDKGKNPDQG